MEKIITEWLKAIETLEPETYAKQEFRDKNDVWFLVSQDECGQVGRFKFLLKNEAFIKATCEVFTNTDPLMNAKKETIIKSIIRILKFKFGIDDEIQVIKNKTSMYTVLGDPADEPQNIMGDLGRILLYFPIFTELLCNICKKPAVSVNFLFQEEFFNYIQRECIIDPTLFLQDEPCDKISYMVLLNQADKVDLHDWLNETKKRHEVDDAIVSFFIIPMQLEIMQMSLLDVKLQWQLWQNNHCSTSSYKRN